VTFSEIEVVNTIGARAAEPNDCRLICRRTISIIEIRMNAEILFNQYIPWYVRNLVFKSFGIT
jgi:hypothetical protein